MNSTIYRYFHDSYGVVENTTVFQLAEKHKGLSNSSLKSQLKSLKTSNSDPTEIKYVAKLLRSKLKHSSKSQFSYMDHDKNIQRNLWGYVKSQLRKDTLSSPSFNISDCTNYFRNFFLSINPEKAFKIPNWIPPLADPSIPYDLSPSTYQQITKIVRRIKASSSPCPLEKKFYSLLSKGVRISGLTSLNCSAIFGGLVKFLLSGRRLALSVFIRKAILQTLSTLGLLLLKTFPLRASLPVYEIHYLLL